jgi:hypothetical protein
MPIRPTSRRMIEMQIDLSRSIEYIAKVKLLVHSEFTKLKQELIKEFSDHPVTVEIEAGSTAQNTSGTLNGKGNLFSFIGFESGDSPTAPIHYKLQDVTIGSTLISRDGSSRTTVIFPTAEEIFGVTPLPWANGRSWAKGVEDGISNLGQYLYKEAPTSRSGRGIQSKGQVSGAAFSPTSYISDILKRFRVRVSTLNKIAII